MRSNYPRSEEPVNSKTPSVLWTAVFVGVNAYLCRLVLLPRLLFGGWAGSDYLLVITWVSIILTGPTLILLWRGSRWSKREKLKVVVLGGAVSSLITTGLSLIRFGEFNSLTFSLLNMLITFIFNTVVLAIAIYPFWVVANLLKGPAIAADKLLNANRTYETSETSVPVIPEPVRVPASSERER